MTDREELEALRANEKRLVEQLKAVALLPGVRKAVLDELSSTQKGIRAVWKRIKSTQPTYHAPSVNDLLREYDARLRELEEAREVSVCTDHLYTTTEVAEELGTTAHELYRFLVGHGWLYNRDHEGYRPGSTLRAHRNYYDYHTVEYPGTDGNLRVKTYMKWTLRGYHEIVVLWRREHTTEAA